jgi:hypothetical protein
VKAEELIRDPIFQLNLLVWAAKEQPDSAAVVTPVFARHGYTLQYIENPFSFPVPTQLKIKDIDDIGKFPTADIIVTNRTKASAFYIEAKKESFGTKSSNCNQARAHLIAAGPVFAEVYSPTKVCRLVYALPEECRTKMEPTLTALAADVARRGFTPGPFSVHGFGVEINHVTYTIDEPSRAALETSQATIPLLPILDGETDPSPLLLVYTDEDTNNPTDRGLYRRILLSQVHAQLLSQLEQCNAANVITLNAEEVLLKTTGGVFGFLGGKPRRSMKVLVRDNVFKRITKFWEDKKPDVFRLKGFELTIRFDNDPNKDEFLDWFEEPSRTKFADDPADPGEVATADEPPQEQGELFLFPPQDPTKGASESLESKGP